MGLTMAKKQTKARKVLQKPPILGWKTNDSDEIELRRCGGGPRLRESRRWSRTLARMGRFAPARAAAVSMKLRFAISQAGPIPAAARTIASTVLELASI